jgi:large subunit ribosomal protein LP2
MKHLAAYLLLGLGGNTSPSAADVKTVLESVGIEADSERLEKLLSELKGKDINEVRPPAIHSTQKKNREHLTNTSQLIASGSEKLASVPSGGAGGAAASGGAAAGGAAPAEEAAAPVEEEKEESDEDMGFGLFD